jgi:hypothetical protein
MLGCPVNQAMTAVRQVTRHDRSPSSLSGEDSLIARYFPPGDRPAAFGLMTMRRF